MNKLIPFILVAIILVSCGETKKEKIGLNLKVGNTYSLSISNESTMKEQIMGKNIEAKVSMNGTMEFKVINQSDSGYDMEVWYSDISMDMDAGFQKMHVSSSAPDTANPMSVIMSKMVDKPFQITLTKTGKVTEIKNIDDLFAGCFSNFPNITEPEQQNIIAKLQQSYGKIAFKGSIEQVTAFYPEKEVSEGDSWETSIALKSGMPASSNIEYELEEVGETYYIIRGEGDLKTDENDVKAENGIPMKYRMKGTISTEIKIDKATGWVIHAESVQSMNGDAEFGAGKGITVKMEMESTTLVDGK